jgi:hypothetical protein
MNIFAQNQFVLNYLWEKQVVLNIVDSYNDILIATKLKACHRKKKSKCLFFFNLIKFRAQKSFIIEIESNSNSSVVINI